MSKVSLPLDDFLAECDEITQRIAMNLGLAEREPNAGIIDALYRDFHTLKGSSNLYSFRQLGSLSHAMESGLEPYRETKTGKIDLVVIDILYDALKTIEKLVGHIRVDGSEPNFLADLEKIIPRLVEVRTTSMQVDHLLLKDKIPPLESSSEAPLDNKVLRADDLPPPVKSESVEASRTETSVIPATPPRESQEVPMSQEALKTETTQSKSAESAASIRVNVSLLDKLMNLVGEMVLVRNQLTQFSSRSDDLEFIKLSQRLNGVTSELQEDVMRTRMQPLGNVLDKFNRVVRDLAKDLNKKIELNIFGADTLLDKSMLEAIKDPLTHLVRNACDHGIEMPDDRRAAGKQETGTVTIKSFHESGQVVVEMLDDGKGLDRQRILAKALEQGLTTAEASRNLSDKEVFQFIFAPGFSTAQKVTTVSGRGVGMDVVRTNIEKIGGTIELASQLGKGTSVRLQIPLTLAIVPALVVRSGCERFCIPQVKLVELVRCDREGATDDESQNRLEILQSRPMLRLRGHLLPLIDLREVLNLSDAPPVQDEDLEDDLGTVNIVVLNADGRRFGLIVEEIQDTSDIVVKPLTKLLKALSVYSGATLMGDGTVSLILDVMGLAEKAGIRNETATRAHADAGEREKQLTEIQEFLLVRLAAKGNYAIPLCLVKRLEEFETKSIEFSGDWELVHYRGSILPLISLNKFFGFDTTSSPRADKVHVVVVNKLGRNFGLMVDGILDIISTFEGLDDSVRDREGMLGGLILPSGITTVIDALAIVDKEARRMNPMEVDEKKAEAPAEKKHLVLAEDSSFFRKLIRKELEKGGYKVSEFENGRLAFEFIRNCSRGDIQGLVSDIEMPEMTGLELAQAIRGTEGWKDLPMMAVTTRYSESDIATGQAAGFNLYFEKLNPEQLTQGLNRMLKSAGGSHG